MSVYRTSSTHGQLNRYVIRFRSTQEAVNFHHGIDYVYSKQPVNHYDIGRTFDGKTVIIYAYARDWTRERMAKQARIRGGKIVGYGGVLRGVTENPVPPAARGIIAVFGFVGLAFGAAWIVKKLTEEPPKPSDEPGILIDPRRGPEIIQV